MSSFLSISIKVGISLIAHSDSTKLSFASLTICWAMHSQLSLLSRDLSFYRWIGAPLSSMPCLLSKTLHVISLEFPSLCFQWELQVKIFPSIAWIWLYPSGTLRKVSYKGFLLLAISAWNPGVEAICRRINAATTHCKQPSWGTSSRGSNNQKLTPPGL